MSTLGIHSFIQSSFEKLGQVVFMAGYRNGTVPPRFNPSIRLSGSAMHAGVPTQQALQGRMLLTLLSSPRTPHRSLPRNLLQGWAWW